MQSSRYHRCFIAAAHFFQEKVALGSELEKPDRKNGDVLLAFAVNVFRHADDEVDQFLKK